MINDIKDQIAASISTKSELMDDGYLLEMVADMSEHCLRSLKAGGKLILAGNGGSFADAQHISAEFTSRFMFDRGPLASLVLGANNSSISAIGNDYGFDQVFSRELEGIAKKGDIFIAISTSGKSKNILNAVEKAINLGIETFLLTGQNKAMINKKCKCINVPSKQTARVQECHILIGHIMCGIVEKKYFDGILRIV